MNNLQSSLITGIALLMYGILCYIVHPWLGFLLDSDGIAYLTIARRVAEGQNMESINGLWSPLNSWLLAPFIQHGFDAWTTAKVMNMSFGAVVIMLVARLFHRFRLHPFAFGCFMLAIPVLMVHHVYLQMFGDVLQLIFVLTYLLILSANQWRLNMGKVILSAVIMGIGFYAKAYSLLFFLVHFSAVLWWLFIQKQINLKKVLQFAAVGFVVILLVTMPWRIALHQRYQTWTLSGLAGALNMSWQINSGKTFSPDIRLLIPPTFQDSPSFWEDPYPSQGKLSTPLSSPSHSFRWIARVGHTVLSAVQCFNDISALGIAILFIGFFYFFFRKTSDPNKLSQLNEQLILITICLIPSGYLLMHIETRYIWLNTFLLMILGAKLIVDTREYVKPILLKAALFILSLTFVIFPVVDMEVLKGKNADLFTYAEAIKSTGIKGSFTSNATDAGRMWVVAYLTGNPFYTIERTDYSNEELIQEMKRYQVAYYLYESENNKPALLIDTTNFELVMKAEGIDVFRLK
jgi:hypothetical protein